MTGDQQQQAPAGQQARQYTRRQFLAYRLAMDGVPIMAAQEAVASTAMEHPEWDMDEAMTWAEWEAQE